MKPLVFDATPLIYLGKVNLIEKVKHFPEEKYTTKSVYREVVEEGKRAEENPKIHEADADVLALAHELNGIALLDDAEGYFCCRDEVPAYSHRMRECTINYFRVTP